MKQMRNLRWCRTILCLTLAGGTVCRAADDAAAPAPEKIDLSQPYHCMFTETPVVIDGVLDDPIWQQAPLVPIAVYRTGEQPLSSTEARMAYDRDYLYVAFKAYDEDIWSYLTERDSSTASEDVLEVFFKPHPERPAYFNFEINALGTVYDAYHIRRAGTPDRPQSFFYRRWARWDCAGLRLAIKIEGTLNDPSDRDQYWIMEVAIPFAELPSLEGRPPQRGDAWDFALCRYDYSIYLAEGRELSSSAPFTGRGFHRYEDWGRLIFD